MEGEIKRVRLDGQVEGVPGGAPAIPLDCQQRFLIDNAEVGVIIGKQGANVQRIRTEAHIYCSILKLKERARAARERVMVLKGDQTGVAAGVKLIAELLVESAHERARRNAERSGDPTGGEPAADTKVTIKFLIHQTQAGSIIGKGGVIIQEMIKETGSLIKLSQDSLPRSTEKTVNITGTPQSIHDAAVRVLVKLAETGPKAGAPVIEYTPEIDFPAAVPPHFPAPGYGAPPAPYGHHAAPAPYGVPKPVAAAPSYGAPAGGNSQQLIAIPSVCAGSVIGKGGAVIKDLKAKSGCHISIGDHSPDNPTERVCTLSGSEQGIKTAIGMIRGIVEAYVPGGRGQGAPRGAPQSYAPQPQYAQAVAYPPQGGYAPYGQQVQPAAAPAVSAYQQGAPQAGAPQQGGAPQYGGYY